MSSLVDRHPNAVQLPLVAIGYGLALYYGRQLHSLTPAVDSFAPVLTPELYNWSTVQLGVALLVLGVARSNQSVLQRIRVFRLGSRQRQVALVCTGLLSLPWATILVAGITLGFTAPFETVWLGAFGLGFVGLAGVAVLLARRMWEIYLTATDQFPYAGIAMDRRRAAKSVALGVLGTGAVATTFAAGRLGPERPRYLGRAEVVYHRDDVRLEASNEAVRLGESTTFELTNTGSEELSAGCGVWWAIQAAVDGSWTHVAWNAAEPVPLCATILGPGETTSVEVSFANGKISEGGATYEPAIDLTPDTYRFILIGVEPYLAVDFEVVDPA